MELSQSSAAWDFRLGRYQDTLGTFVGKVDAVITDPPYSARTHEGHDAGANLANRAGRGWARSDGGIDVFRSRRELSYSHWTPEDVEAFVAFWAPRNQGWFVCLSDSDLCGVWRTAFERRGLTGFQPVPICIRGMTVRMSGDGPSSWAVYANVARPKALCSWGTLPGFYEGPQGERQHIGGKPLWAMQSLIRDYTRVGDLVCDPCAGAATTLIAALREERRAIGSEINEETFEVGLRRLRDEAKQAIFAFSRPDPHKQCAKCGGTFLLAAFKRDRNQLSGRQSWCIRCKAEWETTPEGAWKRFRSWAEKNEPTSLLAPHGWTETAYLDLWKKTKGECESCGAKLNEWQRSGHRLDRIDNNRPHIPGNCRLVCWPCNHRKCDRPPSVFLAEIENWISKYGRGRIPWGEHGYESVALPDIEEFRIDKQNIQIDIFAQP